MVIRSMYVFIDRKQSYKKSYVKKRVDLQKYMIVLPERRHRDNLYSLEVFDKQTKKRNLKY